MGNDITIKPQRGTADAIHHDSGYASRKLWVTIFAMCLIFMGGLVAGTGWGAGLGANLPTVVGGIVGCLAIFAGANVMVKNTAAKAAKPADPKPVAKGAKK